MTGFMYLIGGGEIRNGDTQLIDEDIMAQAPKGSSFVFFGFASQDSSDYANAITSVYGNRFNVVVPTLAKGREFAINAIKSADIIYLGGGNTDELLRVFDKWNLIKHLQIAVKRGAHVVGMSAGAQALSAHYVDVEGNIPKLRKGWGIAPIGVLVHADPDTFSKAKSLWASHDISHTYPFVAIEESTAWRISGTEATKLGSGTVWTISL